MYKFESKIIKSILDFNGSFQLGYGITEGHDWHLLWVAKSVKDFVFENLRENQKINHFPKCEELCFKDKLALNLRKLKSSNPEFDFDINPETYILPS